MAMGMCRGPYVRCGNGNVFAAGLLSSCWELFFIFCFGMADNKAWPFCASLIGTLCDKFVRVSSIGIFLQLILNLVNPSSDFSIVGELDAESGAASMEDFSLKLRPGFFRFFPHYVAYKPIPQPLLQVAVPAPKVQEVQPQNHPISSHC